MTDASQRIADAEAAKLAWQRFVGPAIDTIQADYMKRLIEEAARPLVGDTLKRVEKLAVAMKVADMVREQLNALILDGEVARKELDRAGQIARAKGQSGEFASY